MRKAAHAALSLFYSMTPAPRATVEFAFISSLKISCCNWCHNKKQSQYRPGRSWGFQEVEAPRFQDNRHMKVVRLSAVRTGRLYLEYRWLKHMSIIRTANFFSAKDRVLLCPHAPFQTGLTLFKRTSCIARFSFDHPTNLIFSGSIFVIVT